MESCNVNVYLFLLDLLISFPPVYLWFLVQLYLIIFFPVFVWRKSVSYHLKLGFYGVTIMMGGKSLVLFCRFLTSDF